MNTNDPQFRQLVDWAHKMAQTPSPGRHDVDPPHDYCFGDDPCVCIQLYAAQEQALNRAREAVRHALGPLDAADPGQRDAALTAIDALRGQP